MGIVIIAAAAATIIVAGVIGLAIVHGDAFMRLIGVILGILGTLAIAVVLALVLAILPTVAQVGAIGLYIFYPVAVSITWIGYLWRART